jgi:acyl CoA:acetate/3-ketoacid CoA transferase beta subunit
LRGYFEQDDKRTEQRRQRKRDRDKSKHNASGNGISSSYDSNTNDAVHSSTSPVLSGVRGRNGAVQPLELGGRAKTTAGAAAVSGTAAAVSTVKKAQQILYIQMEYCADTLRGVMDTGQLWQKPKEVSYYVYTNMYVYIFTYTVLHGRRLCESTS